MSTCAPQLGQEVTGFTKPSRRVDRIFIHCSATSNTSITATDVDRWHTDDNGWDCIGYHYFIRSDGLLEYGRTLERDPAAQSGHNAATIAVCLNGLEVEDFTQQQFDKLNWLADLFDASLDDITYHGHNEVAAKSCPVFDYRTVLGLDEFGVRTSPSPSQESPLTLVEWFESQSIDKLFESSPDNWQTREAQKRLAEAYFWARESQNNRG